MPKPVESWETEKVESFMRHLRGHGLVCNIVEGTNDYNWRIDIKKPGLNCCMVVAGVYMDQKELEKKVLHEFDKASHRAKEGKPH